MGPVRRSWAWLVLGLVVAACESVPSTAAPGSPGPPGSSAPGSVPRPGTATEVVPTLEDLLVDGVRTGRWTLEDAVLAGLRALTHEAAVDTVTGGTATEPGSLTGLFLMANDYLASPGGQEAEVRRLLDKATFTAAELEEMASTSGVAGIGETAGLRLAQAAEECELLYAFIDAEPPAELLPCMEVHETEVAGQRFAVYIPIEPHSRPATQYVDATLDALVASAAKYNELAPTPTTVAVLLPTMVDGESGAYVPGEYDGTDVPLPCPIAVFAPAFKEELDWYRQLIAHEVAHCWQAVHLLDANGPGYDVTRWREEGLAEHLSNVVYPEVNAEWSILGLFGQLERSTTILTRSYGNWLFFQYLDHEIGLAELISILQSFPTSGGIDEQSAALAAVPGMEGYYHNFVRDYTTHELVDESGDIIPTIAEATLLEVRNAIDPLVFHEEVVPFGVARYDVSVVFDEPKVLRATFEEISAGARGVESFLVGSLWQTHVPPELPFDCGHTSSFTMVLTATSLTRTYELTVPSVEELDCRHVEVGDACDLVSKGEIDRIFTWTPMDPERSSLWPNPGSACSWHGTDPCDDERPETCMYVIFDHYALQAWQGIGRDYTTDPGATLIAIPGADRAWHNYGGEGLTIVVADAVVNMTLTIGTSALPGVAMPSQATPGAQQEWLREIGAVIAARLLERVTP